MLTEEEKKMREKWRKDFESKPKDFQDKILACVSAFNTCINAFELFYLEDKRIRAFAEGFTFVEICGAFDGCILKKHNFEEIKKVNKDTAGTFNKLVDLAYRIREEKDLGALEAWKEALDQFFTQGEIDFDEDKKETVRFAKHRKVLTSKIARNLIRLANTHGDGKAKARISIKEKNKIVVPFSFNSNAVDVSGRKLTQYDKQVHDAVCTLWGNGIERFTAEEVYRAMNRISDNRFLGNVDLTKITKSLEAAVLRRVKIDATEQLKARKINDIKSAIFEDYFLPLRKIEITNRVGRTAVGWEITSAPAIYSYSEALKQIATIPMSQLDTRKRVKNSETVSRMSDSLITRIEWIKGGSKKAAAVILYSTLFEECEIDYSRLNKTQRQRKRKLVKGILEGFKDNGYIKDFHEEMEARTPKGIRIEVNKEVKKQ